MELVPAGPVGPSAHLLSERHQRFCQEYVLDLNGVAAYMRTYPKATKQTAASHASVLMAQPRITGEIQRLLDERATITGITADRVLLKLWDMATADPRELVEIQIGCCRHCWGMYHQYQYTDAELEKAQDEFIKAEAKRRKAEKEDFKPATFHEKGGGGFERSRQPNVECPECGGDGAPRQILKDTRNLTPGARHLFAGVKVDRFGNTTVLLRDPTLALLKVGEHLGLWNGQLPGNKASDPMQSLLEAIRGQSGTAGALPIVHDDPEAARPPEAIDVESRTVESNPESPRVTPVSKPKWKAT